MFIESAITSVVTPAATPITASSVTIRSTAGRFGERRYRSATSHSKLICFCRPRFDSRPRRLRSRPIPRAAAGNSTTSRIACESVSSITSAVDANSFAGRRRQAVRQRANVIHVHFLRRFLPALFHLRAKTPLLVERIVQLREAVGQFHPGDEQLESLGKRRIVGFWFRKRRNRRRENRK